MALAHQATAATLWAVSLSSERDERSIASHVLGDPKQRNNLIALGIAPTIQSQQGTVLPLASISNVRPAWG